ncbi:MAG: tandem-95 repeat protein [Sedimentisphaerales bacterium]|nr:tandem-95 repeat protein [Sedimentisphaerales bacterium]
MFQRVTLVCITWSALVLALLLVCGASTVCAMPTSLIPKGSDWRYVDTGVDLGTVWQSIGYSDLGWSSGPAQLGFGDNDEQTTITSGHTCYYFRHAFDVTDPSVFGSLTLWVVRDDGCVVYLNGTEVVRSNMPASDIQHGTFASTVVGGTDEDAWFRYSVDAGLLVAGTNVVAVEVHQANATSSDISFDFELSGNAETRYPYQGVRWTHRSAVTPRPLNIHVLEVDLTHASVGTFVTPDNGGDPDEVNARKTTTFVSEFGMQVGINGDFFGPYPPAPAEGAPLYVNGLGVSAGTQYSTDDGNPALTIDSTGTASIGRAPFGEVFHAVGGNRLIVDGGVVTGEASGDAFADELHPRTGVGVDAGGDKLIAVVVDGRQEGFSQGVSLGELADLLIEFGAWKGLNLDGGGSSTMVFEDSGIVNVPSDTEGERAVGNHLGITAASIPTIIAPNGGDRWVQGMQEDITWTQEGIITTVALEYSTDGGATWTTIVGSTENTGSYTWDVPNTPSSSCIIRISDESNPELYETSDAVFTILENPPPSIPSVTLVSPADGTVTNQTDVTFTCSVTDDYGVAFVELYVGGPPEVVTFSGPAAMDDAMIMGTGDSGRPEIIDPTNTNFGSELSINVDGDNPDAHAVIKFPNLIGSGPGQVPLNATIVSATLEVNCTNQGSVMTMYRLLQDWVEGEVTWNNRTAESSGNWWLYPGADGYGSADIAQPVDADCTATGWRSIDITTFVQHWSSNGGNFGIVLTSDGTDGVDFDSSESANPPVLTVTFRPSWVLMGTELLSGATSATVTFGDDEPLGDPPISLTDQQHHSWNCRVVNTGNPPQESWAPAAFQLTVDTHAPDSPVLVAPADGGTVESMSPTLEVTVIDPDGDAMDVTFYGRRISSDDEFTLVVLPDTQFYSESYPQVFTAQTQWIVDNIGARNIAFVTHEGDIVDNAGVTYEWENADDSISLLDGHVPYGMCPGNHDTPTTNYNTYFPYMRYDGESWYGGHYPSGGNDNNYQLFSAGGESFIILHLQYNPGAVETDPVIAWANWVLSTHADRKAIITTHAYLNADATRRSEGAGIWNVLVQQNDNVYFVLCGHVHDEARRTDVVNGREVHQLLADYQDSTAGANGGNGWLRLMRFVPADNTVCVETYSPYLDQFESDTDSQFTLNLPMTPYTLIGTDPGAPSGANASVVWSGLMPGSEYEWYATVTDSTARSQIGPLWRFTAVLESIPPNITPLTGDTTGTTGDPVTLSAIITDQPGVESATVHYTPIGGLETTVAMTAGESNVWSAEVPVASDQVGTIIYYITARDISANSARDPADPGTYDIVVTDNDAPSPPLELTATPVAGGAIKLEWSAAVDNVAVTEYEVYRGAEMLGTVVATEDPSYLDVDTEDGVEYSYTVKAIDEARNSSVDSTSATATADASGPNIDNVAAGGVGPSTATITWTTSEESDGSVVYGIGTPSMEVAGQSGVLDHSVLLAGLGAARTYVYFVKATDAVGNLSTSPMNSFTTAEAAPEALFSDDFESGGFSAGGWATSGVVHVKAGEVPEFPTFAARTNMTAYIERAINTAGYGNVTVSYRCLSIDMEEGEALYAEWSVDLGGEEWNTIDPVVYNSLVEKTDLPLTGADNNPEFRIRFRANANKNKEYGYIDDVVVKGVPMGPPNGQPLAVDDSAATSEDLLVAIDVLVNDSDPDGDSLTVTGTSDPANGIASVIDGTTVEYEPDPDFYGSDAFTYTISDGRSTATATVTVTVTPVNDPPSAADDSDTTQMNTPVVIDVLATDVDPDGDSLTVTQISNLTNGTAEINPEDNTVTFTPDTDFLGEGSFTYEVSDGNGGTDSAVVTVTVVSAEPKVHVASIIFGDFFSTGKNLKAVATVTVHDQAGSPVSGATVVGDWGYQGAVIQTGAMGTTGADGAVVLVSPPVKASSGGVFAFQVTGVTADGYTYDPNDPNGVTDGEAGVP